MQRELKIKWTSGPSPGAFSPRVSPPSVTLFIGSLPSECTEEDLKQLVRAHASPEAVLMRECRS